VTISFVLVFSASLFNIAYAQQYSQIDSVKKHIYYLASEELTGRKPGTPGIEKAAAYISAQFKNIGVKPFGDSYFQPFKLLIGAQLTDVNSLSVNGKELKLGVDFLPVDITGIGKAEGDIAFVGYGLDKNSGKISYDHIDVKGKWVLAIRGSMDPADRSARAISMGDYAKAMTAADKGAVGIILVNPSWSDDDKMDPKAILSRSMGNVKIPVLKVSTKTALKIINKSARFLKSFPTDNEPASFLTESKIKAEVNVKVVYQTTNNVVGLIEGSDPVLKNEYIVIGGHYDHLGMGGPNSRKPDTVAIHYGADDNASGTAGVIELARLVQKTKDSFGRSFIFITFSAEEMGLLGSEYFVSNPLVSLPSIKGMINLDMIGRLKDELTIEGTGSAIETDSLLKVLEKGRPYKVAHSAGAAGGSDHTSFYNKGIPVFFFFSGMHYDYHTPTDTPDKINYQGEVDILSMAYDLARVLGNSKALTYKQIATQYNSGARSYRISLGIMPDVTGNRNDGLEVMDARKGGPAERAGLKKGDVIISINGKEVNNITDYMSRLNTLKKGEKAKVGVKRKDEKLIIEVQL
jgi:hypothetical protein